MAYATISPDLRGTPLVEAINANTEALRTASDSLVSTPVVVAPVYVTYGITSPAGTYTVPAGGPTFIIVDATGGPITVKLPDPASAPGRLYMVQRLDAVFANAVVVLGNNLKPIGGYSAAGGVPLTNAGDWVCCWNAEAALPGAGWLLLSHNLREARQIITAGSTALTSTDQLVLANTGTAGGVITVQLLGAELYLRQELIVKQVGGAAGVNVQPASGQRIDSLAIDAPLVIAAQNDRVRLRPYAGQWWRVD